MGELGNSQEDYLEAILVLQNQHSEVLSVDVARHMNFSKPSVCHAVKQLKGKGFLDVYEDGSLHLTEEGRKLAEGVYERHRFFTEYFMEMGVSAKQAEEDACKMEHIISEESFRALKMGLKKGSSEDGSETYMIKKARLSLNLRPPYSKDRIHKATERIIEEQKEQSKDS